MFQLTGFSQYDMHAVGTAAASMSLILIHQLEDKLKAHDLYLSFLKNVDLWSRVRCRSWPVSVREKMKIKANIFSLFYVSFR